MNWQNNYFKIANMGFNFLLKDKKNLLMSNYKFVINCLEI